jgi:hypothetical protein
VVQQESPDELVLTTPEGSTVTIREAQIGARSRGLSAMPEGLASALTPFELRDLIEYLASLK